MFGCSTVIYVFAILLMFYMKRFPYYCIKNNQHFTVSSQSPSEDLNLSSNNSQNNSDNQILKESMVEGSQDLTNKSQKNETVSWNEYKLALKSFKWIYSMILLSMIFDYMVIPGIYYDTRVIYLSQPIRTQSLTPDSRRESLKTEPSGIIS